MKNSFYYLPALLLFFSIGCFDPDGDPVVPNPDFNYGVNCSVVNCLEEVTDEKGTLRYLDCFGHYGILVLVEIDSNSYNTYKAGIIEDLAFELQQDLPKEVTFTGLYVEKDYPIQFPDPDISIASVNQLNIQEIKLD